MISYHKLLLYFHTIRYLKWTQIQHRLCLKLFHPHPDFSPAPETNVIKSKVPFPSMPICYLGNNRFRFLNEECFFTEWNDKSRNKLWLYNLHYFDWLRQKDISQKEGEYWIEKWIAENQAPIGSGWEPYTLSLRIVNWIKWHLSGHLLSCKAQHSLAVQVRFLMKRLEYHLLANHLIANAKALIFAGRFFTGPEAKKWLDKGMKIYREELVKQILADGGHFELSPMYHSIILEDLLDLKNIHAPIELDEYITKMLRWLAVMTGPDGKISFFNDASHGIALNADIIEDYGKRLGFKSEATTCSVDLPQSGYSRLQNDHFVCICDTGNIGPSYQPGHSHADALSFELWKNNRKILTNCGTGHYTDSFERRFQRSSAAHNTLLLDENNSSEVWSAHRVARRGKILKRSFHSNSCAGVFRTWQGITCIRSWQLENDGSITVKDKVLGKETHTLSFVFHPLAPDIKIDSEPQLIPERMSAIYSPEFGKYNHIESVYFTKKSQLPFTIKFRIS